MATVDSYETVKGTVDDNLAFHFDIANDVLYLRLVSTLEREVVGEETPDGFLLFRTEDEKIAGMTIIDYWERFGAGRVDDMTIRGLQTSIETRVASLPLGFAV
jgi:hypothetical protein